MNESYVPNIHTMLNGVQVIAVQRPYSKLIAAALIYRTGSFDDPSGLPGTAHFAEHLAFAGPNKELAARLAGFGANVNGSTGYDFTEFEVVAHIDELELALSFFANILRNQIVTDDDIASERDVFFHELEDCDDPSSREAKYDSFWRRVMGDPNWRVSQRKHSVKTKLFTADRLNAFKQQHFDARNARFAIVGPVAHTDLQRLIESCLPSDVASSPSPEKRPDHSSSIVPLTISRDRHAYIWLDVVQTVTQGRPAVRLAADIIGHLLGGGPNSEMFRHFRIERSIAYSAYADDLAYLDSTVMHCFCSVPKRSIQEALTFVVQRLDEIGSRGISESQLEGQKQRMIRCHEMAMDNPRGLAAYLAYETLRPTSECIMRPDGYRSAVTSLTLTEVNEAAAELLSKRNRSTFVGGRLGPIARWRIRQALDSRHIEMPA